MVDSMETSMDGRELRSIFTTCESRADSKDGALFHQVSLNWFELVMGEA